MCKKRKFTCRGVLECHSLTCRATDQELVFDDLDWECVTLFFFLNLWLIICFHALTGTYIISWVCIVLLFDVNVYFLVTFGISKSSFCYFCFCWLSSCAHITVAEDPLKTSTSRGVINKDLLTYIGAGDMYTYAHVGMKWHWLSSELKSGWFLSSKTANSVLFSASDAADDFFLTSLGFYSRPTKKQSHKKALCIYLFFFNQTMNNVLSASEVSRFKIAVIFFFYLFCHIEQSLKRRLCNCFLCFFNAASPAMSDPWQNHKQVLNVWRPWSTCVNEVHRWHNHRGCARMGQRQANIKKKECDKGADLRWDLVPRLWGHRWGQRKEGREEGRADRPRHSGGLWDINKSRGVFRCLLIILHDTMRLLALLLVIGAAGKDRNTHRAVDVYCG